MQSAISDTAKSVWHRDETMSAIRMISQKLERY
jgi:hypothetical protein